MLLGVHMIVRQLRYSMKSALLSLWCWRRGIKCRILTNDISEIRRVLRIDDKGSFIEEFLGAPGWHPILSLESSNGTEWQLLRRNFAIFKSQMGWSLQKLSKCVRAACDGVPVAVETAVTSDWISKVNVSAICAWLFDHELSRADMETLYRASIEFRKHIAIKGVRIITLYNDI